MCEANVEKMVKCAPLTPVNIYARVKALMSDIHQSLNACRTGPRKARFQRATKMERLANKVLLTMALKKSRGAESRGQKR